MLPYSLGALAAALHNCRQHGRLSHALRLLSFMLQYSLESHPILGNYVVPALVECGSMPDAQAVLDRLPCPNEFTWNSILVGYIDCGSPQNALLLYERMQADQLQPNNYVYVSLFKACARLKDVERGALLHMELLKHGSFQRDLIIGNTLVDMYGKCGSIAEARCIFDRLPIRDAVSWNTLFTAYADHGLVEEALDCTERMHIDGIGPSRVTFLCSLKACGILGVMEKGHMICAEITRKGLENDIFVGSAIVDMYVKCGSLIDAQNACDCMPVQNEVAWNALIAGYTEYGSGDVALKCFEKMKKGNILPDGLTYSSIFKACTSIAAMDIGQVIYSELLASGLGMDINVGTSLVNLYAKCGFIADAQHVFNRLTFPDAVSWAALISGYVDNLLGEEALDCLNQMQLAGIYLSFDVLSCSLKACAIAGALFIGQGIHAEITRRDWEQSLHLGTALVDMYAKCGSLAEAQAVFGSLSTHDAISWAALISGYAEQGHGDEAVMRYRQMPQDCVLLTPDTCACGLKSCAIIGDIETGQELHMDIVKRGLEREPFVGTALVDLYAKCGWLEEGATTFGKLPVQCSITWNVLITAYSNHKHEELLNILEEMQIQGETLNIDTFACRLKACGVVGSMKVGLELHTEVIKRGLEKDLFVGSTMLDMYANCGLPCEAQELFNRLPFRDVASWNALIKAYGENHESNMAIQCFKEMQEQGIRPNAITFTCLLTACSHGSLVAEGQKYFKMMVDIYQIEPRPEHCVCVVDLLARSGHILEAERFAEVTHCLCSAVILRAILSACKIHRNLEVGLRCFQQLIHLNQEDSAAYLLMADIFASSGKWLDAKQLEETRIDAEAKKKPGSALISVNKTIYEFVVGDKQSKLLSSIWELFGARMKVEGYTPNLEALVRENADEHNTTHHVCSKE